nr:uncharacterized protein LOC109182299 [Ipomoea batatas]
MAAKQQESRLSLKLLIDEKSNRVVAAEAHKEFVEILFSFLTLPMGTIIRVTSSGDTKNPVTTIGCMNNLYRAVEKLSIENWETENCKTMVLHPQNPLGNYCQKLEVNIDDSWPVTNYWCYWCRSTIISWYPNVTCTCGRKTTLEIPAGVNNVGAFLQKGRTMFIISDDLQISPACPSVLAQLLYNLGLSDMDGIREMLVEVSKKQVISLLARSLVSESPLSDVFLPNNPTKHDTKFPKPETERTLQTTEQNEPPTPTPTLNLQVTLNKSTNKILFAKATNEFFDFLCTFLTIPIGSIIHVLKRNLGGLGGCIHNLYTSVEELEDKWFGSCLKSAILNPQIAQYHNCKKQPLKLDVLIEIELLLDPRPNQNFAGEPLLFLVLDNLDVKPLSSASSSLILRELKVPFRDVEDQVITVGMNEVIEH